MSATKEIWPSTGSSNSMGIKSISKGMYLLSLDFTPLLQVPWRSSYLTNWGQPQAR